jgi:L-2-hydroxyglutarate oxidase
MVEFCREHGVQFDVCGKVIVATAEQELTQLETLYVRGTQNELRVERIGPEELREIEPHVRGLAAIRVSDAGIVDYKGVCQTLARLLGESGCNLYLNHEVTSVLQSTTQVELIADDKEPGAIIDLACGPPTAQQCVRERGELFSRGLIPPTVGEDL